MALPPSSSLSAASAQPTPLHLHLHLHLSSRAPGRLPLLPFSRAALPPPPSLRARIPRASLLPAAGPGPGTPPPPLHHHRALLPPPSASASPSIAGGGFGSDDHHGGDVVVVTEPAPGDPEPDVVSGGGDDEGGGAGDGGEGGGGDDSPGSGGDPRGEALFVLAQLGRKLDSLPSDLTAAIESGRIGGDIVSRFAELEANGFLKWLLQFRGFRERLLADDLFLTKLGIECGIGLFAKSAAEWQKRGDNFFKEIEVVISDVVMAIVADVMLVYLPAPTVGLKPPLARNATAIAKFFSNCPDNAFQVALAGRSFTLVQRLGAFVRNAVKLFAVGSTASFIGTNVTNVVLKAKAAVDKDLQDEVVEIPVLQTSISYGIYMSISSNLRYSILAGVIEQRMLEPLLHNQKLILSAMSFIVRTGNTFLGSLLWIDYARWIGLQKSH